MKFHAKSYILIKGKGEIEHEIIVNHSYILTYFFLKMSSYRNLNQIVKSNGCFQSFTYYWNADNRLNIGRLTQQKSILKSLH